MKRWSIVCPSVCLYVCLRRVVGLLPSSVWADQQQPPSTQQQRRYSSELQHGALQQMQAASH